MIMRFRSFVEKLAVNIMINIKLCRKLTTKIVNEMTLWEKLTYFIIKQCLLYLGNEMIVILLYIYILDIKIDVHYFLTPVYNTFI